ncbi:MAG: hypothetical protein CR975_04385 [Gammaproteobacteria bacterium]|nr:MAG: hypothetical protein CR975_04385 [Gammaproteobacteria bacterium]
MVIILRLISHYWCLLTAILLLLITLLSLWPAVQLPLVPGTDKTHHVIAYAVLMLPAAIRRPSYWLWVAAGFIAYSGMIELLQPFVNRYAEWLDLLANALGVVCGGLIGYGLHTLGRVKTNCRK